MMKEPDEIDVVMLELKRESLRNHSPDWDKIEHDLRAFYAEFAASRTLVFGGLSGETYRRDMLGTASIPEARKLLRKTGKELSAAKEVPDCLAQFAARTYGDAGLASLPRQAIQTYQEALTALEDYLTRHNQAFERAVCDLGNIQGSKKGPLLQHLDGAPIVRFLQRLIPLWREATVRDTLGDRFETFAKRMVDIGLPHRADGQADETGDLSRRIKEAKRRGSTVSTEWTHITEIMNLQRMRAPSPVSVRPAVSDDAPSITATVCAAYLPYIERIGKQPGPMLQDYAATLSDYQAHVAIQDNMVVGTILLQITDEGFCVDNVAVRPAVKGLGVGRRLLELAESEARRQEFDSIHLATHELMAENRALYVRIGYVQYDHRVVNGYPCVFMRKNLA
jgi:GNAT superfamily N-acetyltransferase